jgi:hypothetical protein
MSPEDQELAVPAVEFCSVDDGESVDSIIPGILIPGSITEFDASPKMGKTTLGLAMVKAITTGAEFLGRKARPGRVVWISEEGRPTLREALGRAGLDQSSDVYVVAGMAARRMPWPALVAAAVELCKQIGAETLGVDTLAGVAGFGAEAENDAASALEAVTPLRIAADAGLAVSMYRHARKSGGAVGESGRGSSAFAGSVDSIFLLTRPDDAPNLNVRRILGISRFDDAPTELDIEWTEDGYVSRGDPASHASRVMEAAILDAIPSGEANAIPASRVTAAVPRLSDRRARERLEELYRQGELGRIGAGKRGNPHLFYRLDQTSPAKFPAHSSNGAPETAEPNSRFPAEFIPPETAGNITTVSTPRFPAFGAPPLRGGVTRKPPETPKVGLTDDNRGDWALSPDLLAADPEAVA